MNWKSFLAVLINVLFIAFPYNILGCSDGPDPYDYYTSFFHNHLAADKSFKPFYYSNYVFLYNKADSTNIADTTSAEWIPQCGNTATAKQAYDFVCNYAYKDVANLYNHLEKKQPLAIPDSVQKNPFTQYFLQKNDLEALGYLMYAKKVQPFAAAGWNNWDASVRDSLKMAALMKSGMQLYKAAKTDFIKLRYAYQITRLAHYNGLYQLSIEWNDTALQPNATKSILHPLGNALKAGALFRLGRNEEAAYQFAQFFFKNDYRRISNYISFDWAVKRMDNDFRNRCLQRCTTNEEKANVLALFALGSNEVEMDVLQKIYQLNANASVLPVLTTRELNKVEENAFGPALQKTKGGSSFYFNDYDEQKDNVV